MDWDTFKNQPHNDMWISLDELTLGQFKEAVKMCKSCKVTGKEMMSIVQNISTKFNLSPKDAFDLFSYHGKSII